MDGTGEAPAAEKEENCCTEIEFRNNRDMEETCAAKRQVDNDEAACERNNDIIGHLSSVRNMRSIERK